MTAKEYLRQALTEKARIEISRRRIADIRQSIAGIGSPTISDDIKAKGTAQDKMAERVASLVDLEAQYQIDLSQYLSKEREIIERIMRVKDDVNMRILYYKYIEARSFREIGELVGFSWRHVIRMHGSALVEFGEVNSDVIGG